MAADLGVRGVPADGNLPYDQGVGVSAPVSGPTLHAYRCVAARCGRQRMLEPPATPSRRFDLAGQSLPREVDWAGAEGSHTRTPGRTHFRIQLHRLSGTVPHQSETRRDRRFGDISNETLRGVHRPE